MRLFILSVTITAPCLAAEPDLPTDLSKWVNVIVPRDGTRAYERFWLGANHSRLEWFVSPADGKVTAHTTRPRKPSPDFALGGKEVPEIVRSMRPQHEAIQVSDGWLVGYSAGEWGGALFWYSTDGKANRQLSTLQVNQFLETKDGVYAITGLSHLGLEHGSVVAFIRKGGKWVTDTSAELPGCGHAAAALPRGGMVVAAGDQLVRVDRNGGVQTLARDCAWSGWYPNSVAVGAEGEVYVGMRRFVAVYDPKDSFWGVHLRVPTKEHLRPTR